MPYSLSMTPTEAAFTAAIRVRLTRLGITQEVLAQRLDMHPASLSARLNGRTPMDLADIERIAVALGLSDMFALIDLARTEHAEAAA